MRTLLNTSKIDSLCKDYKKTTDDENISKNKDMLVDIPDVEEDDSFEVYKAGFLTPYHQESDDEYGNNGFISVDTKESHQPQKNYPKPPHIKKRSNLSKKVKKENPETPEFFQKAQDFSLNSEYDSKQDILRPKATKRTNIRKQGLISKNNGIKKTKNSKVHQIKKTNKKKQEKSAQKKKRNFKTKINKKKKSFKKIRKKMTQDEKDEVSKSLKGWIPELDIKNLKKYQLKNRKYFKRKKQRDKKLLRALKTRVYDLVIDKKRWRKRRRSHLIRTLNQRKQMKIKKGLLEILKKKGKFNTNSQKFITYPIVDFMPKIIIPHPLNSLNPVENHKISKNLERYRALEQDIRKFNTYSEQLNHQFTFFEGNIYSTLTQFINYL